jgi:hypothetical protein
MRQKSGLWMKCFAGGIALNEIFGLLGGPWAAHKPPILADPIEIIRIFG